MKKLLKIFIIYLFFVPSFSFATETKQNLQYIYKLLQEKKFEEGIKNLQILSEYNEINAQLLYSKILFSGDFTPQDFETSYFWGFAALLGGLKKSSNILEKLEKYLTEKKIEEITIKLRDFLEKRAFAKDKRAIIQLAKLYEKFTEPPDLVNAYTWYNIAVAQGIKTAKSKRDELLDNLNEENLLEAQTLSIKLFKKINN
jgi:TPR repeat protein